MHSPKVLADRFRVFSYVKRIKKEGGRIPSHDEIADELDVPRGSIHTHINALRKADGFPRYRRPNEDRADSSWRRNSHINHMKKGHDFDENALLLTDIFAVTDG